MNLFDAEILAKQLIAEYNPGLNFEWSRSKTAIGDYMWSRRRLRLSRVLIPLMKRDDVIVTIKHELAHSLAPVNSGHGWEWKRIMINTFNLPAHRCSRADINLSQVPNSWRSRCPNGHVGTKTYMRKPTALRSCGKCNPGRFDSRYIVTYVQGLTV